MEERWSFANNSSRVLKIKNFTSLQYWIYVLLTISIISANIGLIKLPSNTDVSKSFDGAAITVSGFGRTAESNWNDPGHFFHAKFWLT